MQTPTLTLPLKLSPGHHVTIKTQKIVAVMECQDDSNACEVCVEGVAYTFTIAKDRKAIVDLWLESGE